METMEPIIEAPPIQATASAPEKPEKKKQSKLFTEYYAALFLFMLAADIGVAFFLIRPIIERIKEQNAQTTVQLQTLAEEQRYLSSLEQSVAAAQTISPTTLQQVNQALPADPHIASLLVQFESSAKRNNVRIDTLNFVEPHIIPAAAGARAATSSAQTMDINVSVRARSYLDVKRFLNDIETNLRLMDLIGMTSSFRSDELAYNLQLRTYSFASKSRP